MASPIPVRTQIRLVAGFVVAPLAGLIVVALASCYLDANSTFRECLQFSPVFLVMGGAWAYSVAIIFGAPLFYLCVKRRWLQWWQALLAGTACGLVLPLLLSLFQTNVLIFALDIPVGMVAGLVFWFLAMHNNAL